MKKIISILMACILCFCLPTPVAMAAENTNPEVIRLSIEPGEEIILSNGDYGVMPAIWNQNSYTLGSGTITYTGQMYIPDRYFAFEAYALDTNGNAVGGSFSVALYRYASAGISGLEGNPNGTVYKKDWIDLGSPGDGYHFKIYNGTTGNLVVYITYYSWA